MEKAITFLNENTTIPFKIVVPIVMAILSAAAWIQFTLFQIQVQQKEAIQRAEFRLWRNELAERNVMLKVPYIDSKPVPVRPIND